MQVTFKDLNPYLYYKPSTPLYRHVVEPGQEEIDIQRNECIEELQQAFEQYEDSVVDVANGTLNAGQIRINGEIRTFEPWDYNERTVPGTMRTYMRYRVGGEGALVFSVIGIPFAYLYAAFLPASAFLTVPALVALAVAGIYYVCIKTPSMMQEMQIQTVLDAQNYLMGPNLRGNTSVNTVYNAFLDNERRNLASLPLLNIAERVRIDQRLEELIRSEALEKRKYYAINQAFLEMRRTDEGRAIQIVIKIFKGIYDPDVLAFQSLAQDKFDRIMNDNNLILP